MKLINSRLAAKSRIRQEVLDDRANAAARAVDVEILHYWNLFVEKLSRGAGSEIGARMLGRLIHQAAVVHLKQALWHTTRWGQRASASIILDTVSLPYLRALAMQFFLPRRPLFEAGRKPPRVQTSVPIPGAARRTKPRPGIIALAARALGLVVEFVGGLFRVEKGEEPVLEEFPEERQRDIFAELLFPPPDAETVTEILYQRVNGQNWFENLARVAHDYASPEKLAAVVSTGFAEGKTPQQIAKAMMPLVNNVRSTAVRLARTHSMRVAHEIQMRTYQGLGELCIGFQIHATLDEVTRPAHRTRHGTIYYKEPKASQKGLEEMPQPPLEADGSVAWNCRCHLSPVLAPDPAFQDPALTTFFQNNEDKLVSDPIAYEDWFAQTDERRQRRAVGPRRYLTVQRRWGQPTWPDFVDPETGELMAVDALSRETGEERAARIAEVRRVIAERAAAIRSIQNFGFLRG